MCPRDVLHRQLGAGGTFAEVAPLPHRDRDLRLDLSVDHEEPRAAFSWNATTGTVEGTICTATRPLCHRRRVDPGNTSVNPFVTITALAERNIEKIIATDL